jgi:general secretion pathway protein A
VNAARGHSEPVSSGKERLYLDFFDLREAPFSITPDPEFLYFSTTHQSVFDKALYGINNRSGFILLTGEVGSGKTTLCRSILDSLDGKAEMVYIINPTLSGAELLRGILDDLGIDTPKDATKKDLFDHLNRFAMAAAQTRPVVIIIDDAQTMSIDALEDLRLLSNLETDKEKLLQMVLVGQPELLDLLSRPEIRQLRQRVVINCRLDLLMNTEVEGYIDRRLFVAGNKGQVRFTRRAKQQVANASGGIPRLINTLCDYALTAAYIDNSFTVRPQHVKRAETEIGKLDVRAAGEGRVPAAVSGPRLSAPLMVTAAIALVLVGALAATLIVTPPSDTAPPAAAPVADASSLPPPPKASDTGGGPAAPMPPAQSTVDAASAPDPDVAHRETAMTAPMTQEHPKPPAPIESAAISTPSVAPGAHAMETTAPAARPDGDVDARPAPFVLQFGSYRTLGRTQRAEAQYREAGIETHWNSVDLGDQGIWFRLFTGRFESRAAALAFKSAHGIDEAMVVKAPWTVLIAEGLPAENVAAMQDTASRHQIDLYTVLEKSGRFRVMSGAFVTHEGARGLARELAVMGYDATVVRR